MYDKFGPSMLWCPKVCMVTLTKLKMSQAVQTVFSVYVGISIGFGIPRDSYRIAWGSVGTLTLTPFSFKGACWHLLRVYDSSASSCCEDGQVNSNLPSPKNDIEVKTKPNFL